MGIKYSEVKENELLPEELIKTIPSNCSECNTEIEFSNSLDRVYCPNRECELKIAYRLKAMADKMYVQDFTIENSLKIVKTFKLKSPAQALKLFRVEDSYFENNEDLKVLITDLCNSKFKDAYAWEIVKYLSIPDISIIARQLFEGYNSLKEAFEDISKYQVLYVLYRLGIEKSGDTGVLAMAIYKKLLEYKQEILAAQDEFNLIEYNDIIKVYIYGELNSFINYSEYISYMNFLGRKKYIIRLVCNPNDADIIVSNTELKIDKQVKNEDDFMSYLAEIGRK